MAPGKPVHSVKIRVPRHNAQKIGAKLSGEVAAQARAQDIRTDTYQPNSESAAALNQAIESASEWNSMLITARAERGPQWDMGTQQFLVDEYSDLYYDSTPLFEAIKKQAELENAEEQKQHQQAQLQHEQAKQAHLERAREREREHQLQLQNVQQMAMLDHPPSPQRQYSNPAYPPYGASPGMPPNMGNMRGPYAGGGAPFNPGGPQPGYYNNGPMGGPMPQQSPARMMGGMDSPMRMGMGMGGGGMMGMAPGPDMSHMGMQPGMMNRGGGMPGGMMAPPNPARRVTRGSMYDDAPYNPTLG
ncbi:hypothetical protein MSAN_00378800 [Mycena sanguinolenta]|uniref:Uncharacterized protein n=1 Tax=Mycena sanguinolenta TaxID=230812 RepID=A0A8H6ZC51_9AGAR|nr:hypothetical protein MSAN_00378800 [Mycena sanguinolenta]